MSTVKCLFQPLEHMFQHLEYIFQWLKYMFQLLKQNFYHREKTFIALSYKNLSTMFRKSRSYAMKNGEKAFDNDTCGVEIT